jgi:hypothetical protein
MANPASFTSSSLFCRVQESSELSPVIDINGVIIFLLNIPLFAYVCLQVHCISQLQDGLFFVLTSVDNISPSLGFEMLGRIVKVLKDYCGVLDEETVRSHQP